MEEDDLSEAEKADLTDMLKDKQKVKLIGTVVKVGAKLLPTVINWAKGWWKGRRRRRW